MNESENSRNINYPPNISGEERERQKRIVDEILQRTGYVSKRASELKLPVPLQRMTEIKKRILEQLREHPLGVHPEQASKIILDSYLSELNTWSKDDLILVLTTMQHHSAMRALGFAT